MWWIENKILAAVRLCALGVLLAVSVPSPVRAEFDNTDVLVQSAVNDMYQKRFKQAHKSLQEAYEQSPRHPGVHFNLARLFEITGNMSEALKEYQMAAVLDPSLVAARRGIARCSVEMKRAKSFATPPSGQIPANAQYLGGSTNSGNRAPIVIQTPANVQSQPVYSLPAPPIRNQPVSQPTYQGPDSYAVMKPPTRPVIPLPSETGEGASPEEPAPTQPAVELPPMPASTQLPAVETLRVPPLPVEVKQKVRERSKNPTQHQAENLLARGDATQAIEVLQKNESDSDNPDVLFSLGKAFSMKGDLFSAIKHLEEAIKVDDRYHEAYYLLAQNYAKVNLLDDAMKNYQAYFAVKPQAAVALEIARTYERMGKPDFAKEYYSKANAMNPGNASIQGQFNQSQSKLANDLYLRANQALTTGDYLGAVTLYQQALSSPGLDPMYQRDAARKLEIARLRSRETRKEMESAREGFDTTRKIYATVNLKYYQLAAMDFHTKFTQPITIEWRGYIARSFRKFGRDCLLMIKELDQEELDSMKRDQNDYRLNPNFNNQPIFLLMAKQGELPSFARPGSFITFTGVIDWQRMEILNELGQSVKVPALEFLSAHPD